MFAQKFGNNLEQHLVNLANRSKWAKAENDDKKTREIDNWFAHFENQLKKLLEDNSAHLEINPDTLKYTIVQDSKPPYTFQQLSAGYRAILDIYAELLMRTEYFKVMPNELTGVVLVDEIDTHLHLSLQRLILPFFTESFPKIQFIVTTHSPFVLMSTPDTIVFDLAQNEPITEDLSYYTYSAVMKGLWNIKPIAISLEESIKEIARILNAEIKDFERLKSLVDKIKKYEDVLDPESKSFFLRGLEALEEHENV
jgi:predicted ATP-dependent endonuclease of OLD family